MIELRNRVRFAAGLSPLLVLLACSSQPDEVKPDQSAAVFTGSLSLTLLSVIQGTTLSTDYTEHVGIAFPNFTVPPATGRWFNLPGSVDLGNCVGPYSATKSCNGLQLPTGAWKKSVAVDTNQPVQTIIYPAEVYIAPQGGLGSPTFARCFHFGLDTKTYKLKPVAVSRTGCDGNGPDDTHDPVTCDATTCTASISIGSGGDPLPWKVKFGYNVTVPAITGHVTITPDFFISNVYYAPPGKSSSIAYSSTTSTGTSTSTTQSFQGSLKVTATGSVPNKITMATGESGSVAISEGHTWGDSQMDQLDVSVDRSNGYKVLGQVDGIDHNWDQIWLLMRPELIATYTQPIDQTLPSYMDWQFAPNQDGVNNAVPLKLFVGWLNGQIAMPTDVKGTLDHFAIDPSYYARILAADPLASGALYNPQQDVNRYNFLGQYPFEPPLQPGGQPDIQTYSLTQKKTTTSTSTSMDSWTTGFTVTYGTDLGTPPVINLKFMTEGSFTWTNSSSTKLSNGTTTMDTLTIGEPQFGYQGPILVKVYEDTIYKSYVFSLDPLCGGTGDGTQYCNQGTGQQCVSTVWGFEPGEPFAWGNSAETSSSLATERAHGGTQSLRISASSDPSLPASINTTPCFSANQGTMDLRGQTYSAWVYVPTSTSSYTGTSCRLRAFDASFHESAISSQATSAPIVPGAWFKLTGVFPFTPVEAAIYELTVDCKLPTDWTLGDPTKVWYVDDVSVGLMAQ